MNSPSTRQRVAVAAEYPKSSMQRLQNFLRRIGPVPYNHVLMTHSGPVRLLVFGIFALSSTMTMAQRTALHDHHVFHRTPSPAQSTRAISPASGSSSHSVTKGPKAKFHPAA